MKLSTTSAVLSRTDAKLGLDEPSIGSIWMRFWANTVVLRLL
jgi:hypothetical protein